MVSSSHFKSKSPDHLNFKSAFQLLLFAFSLSLFLLKIFLFFSIKICYLPTKEAILKFGTGTRLLKPFFKLPAGRHIKLKGFP